MSETFQVSRDSSDDVAPRSSVLVLRRKWIILSFVIPGTLAGITGILLLLADGFVFGIAAKKAVTSVLLIIVGLVLASFIGLHSHSTNLLNSIFEEWKNRFLAKSARRFFGVRRLT